jgi:hypothetical protein
MRSFKNGQILTNEKRSNKGQIFFKDLLEILFKLRMSYNIVSFAQISSNKKQALKYTIFFVIQKRPKNDQINLLLAKHFKKAK